MARAGEGYWELHAPDVRAGDRYSYRLDGSRTLPDPASRFQPEGVHGPSQVIDPHAFEWTDAGWTGTSLEHLIIYELHVGAFSPAGTFAGAAAKLDEVARLGVTAIEIMPVAEFPGKRNWGYDGVDLFAPSRAYGTPDDLRALVDTAHALGLAVILDVVYNHLGPEGAYLTAFSPDYFTERHKSPWGAGVNLDGERSGEVRAFFIENALHWLAEYHVDGFRLDATHALSDDGPQHFLAEFVTRVRARYPRALVIAEDERKPAGGASTRCGPTTSTTSCDGCSRATTRATSRSTAARCPTSRGPSRAGGSCAGRTTTRSRRCRPRIRLLAACPHGT
jgi:maltooligosyltrehalose trehalohydrolase